MHELRKQRPPALPRLAWCFVLVLVLGTLATGCKLAGTNSASVSGTTLILDDKDPMQGVFGGKEYTLFDGAYPERWPEWLKLPEKFYIRKGGIDHAEKTDSLHAAGMSKTPQQELVRYFTTLFDGRGMAYEIKTSGGALKTDKIKVQPAPDAINEIYIIIGTDPYDNSLTTLQVRLYFGTNR